MSATRRKRAPRRAAPALHPSLVGWRGRAKRALDVAVALSALSALSPLLAAVAALVAVTSRGPVLYRQRRLGLRGQPFTIYKFRTMVAHAEADGRAVWAVEDDPRCTPVGGLLRRYGLDELPQLWNVLRGEMSLVGPRPERPEFAREFGRRWPRYAERTRVRCGLTGLAQVEGYRGDTPVCERLALDLRYAAGWSLAGDLSILLRTIPALLRRTPAERARGGAYPAGGEQEA